MKCLKIVNYSKFKNWLDRLESGEFNEMFYKYDKEGFTVSNLATILGLPYKTVSNWFNKGTKPNSDSLYKIFYEFPELNYDDLGVKEYDDRRKTTNFQIRLKQLMKENNINNKQLAVEVSVDKSSVSNWIKGNTIPSKNILVKLAKYFNVTTEFLLGTSDNREVYNVNKKTLKKLERDNPDTLEEFNGETYTKKELGEKYFDLKEYLIDENLIYVMKEEIDRILNWYTDDNYYSDFEDTINSRGEIKGIPVEHTYRYTVKEIAYNNIHKEVDKILDRYVAEQLKEKEMSDNILQRDRLYVENLKGKHKEKNK